MFKKAQASGGRAAALIAIIAVIIIIYIALLPPAERYELLYGENLSDNGILAFFLPVQTICLENISPD